MPPVRVIVPSFLTPFAAVILPAAILNLPSDKILTFFCIKVSITAADEFGAPVPLPIVVRPLAPVPALSAIESISFVPVKNTPFVPSPSLMIAEVIVEPEILTVPPTVLSTAAPLNPPIPATSVIFNVWSALPIVIPDLLLPSISPVCPVPIIDN